MCFLSLCEKMGFNGGKERERKRKGLMLNALTEQVRIEDDTSTLVNL